MIAAVGLGALAGGVVFLLVLHLARPRPAPLVELARFDAAHTQGSTAGQASLGRARVVGRLRACRPRSGRGWPGS